MSKSIAIPDTDSLIWRAYGQFVKQSLLGGNSLEQGIDYLYVCPPSEHGIRGGRPIPDAVTNYNIFKYADSLQRADSPLFFVGAELSYIDSLRLYLLGTEVKEISDTDEQKIIEAINKQADVDGALEEKRKEAVEKWKADSDAQKKGTTFSKWAITHAKAYLALEKQARLAAGQVRLLQSKYYGASADLIQEKLDKIQTLAGADDTSNPGYNMQTYPFDYEINPYALENDFRVENLDASKLVYQPLYVIDGYESTCDSWIKGAAGNDTTWTLNLQAYNHNDWTELGHSSQVSRQSSSFFFFFSKTSTKVSDETQLHSTSADWYKSTTITIKMKGPAQTFNMNAGLWDVPNVRRQFPKLLKGEFDTALGLVRTYKILVGYQVSYEITFAQSLRDQVRDMISQAKSEFGGGLRILGIQFGADKSSGTSFSRDLNSVSYDSQSGHLSVPATPAGIPVLLGVLGRKITSERS